MGQVETSLGTPVTRTQLWLAQAPPPTEQCVWDVVALAAIAAMEIGGRYMAAELKGRGGRVEPAPLAGGELAERAAVRAVTDFWGRLQGFA